MKCRFPALESLVLHFRNGGFHDRTGGVKPSGILKYVKKTGNTNAQMYFSVDSPKEFAKYTNTKLLEVDGFFQKALKDCHGLKLSTKIYMYFADRWNRTLVVHLRFNVNGK